MKSNLRLSATLIATCIFISILLLIGYGAALQNRFIEADKLWLEYNQEASRANDALQRIQAHMGYGGFIHQFKNYILRRDEHYYASAKEHISAVVHAIRDYQSLPLKPAEKQALNDLHATITEYNAKLHLSHYKIANQLGLPELDNLVRVDDTAAMAAINILAKTAMERSREKELETTASMKQALNLMNWGILVIPLIMLLGYTIIVTTKRLLNTLTALAASEKDLDNLIDCAPDPMISADPKGRIIRANQQAQRLFGYSREEFSTLVVEDLIPEAQRHHHAKQRKLFFSEPHAQHAGTGRELMAQARDGSIIPTEITLNRVMLSGQPVAIANIRDIRDRLRAEEAERESKAKSEFISHMSHELRTPLNAIIGFAHIIEEDQEDLSESNRENIGFVLSAAWNLLDLVEDILDFASAARGKFSFTAQATSLGDTVTECVNMVRERANSRNIKIHIGDSCHGVIVNTDPKRLKQVILNLLTNAVKYNCDRGLISMYCNLDLHNGLAELNVEDTGVGIDPQGIERIFEPFNRLGKEGSAIPGAGIGLSLVKNLTEAMSGTVSVSSEPGVGSTFTVRFPLAEECDAEALTHQAEHAQETASTRILYIEDNPLNSEVVSRLFEKYRDIEFHTAGSGAEGLSMARNLHPDLLLVDIRLPDISGFDVIERLKNDASTRNIPAIAISAYAHPEDRQQGLEEGFQRYITKPIIPTDLEAAVFALLKDSPEGGLPH